MNHKDLDVWKEGINFVKKVYRITSEYPDTEKFGLITQIRRAGVSIPANISEGPPAYPIKNSFIFYTWASDQLQN